MKRRFAVVAVGALLSFGCSCSHPKSNAGPTATAQQEAPAPKPEAKPPQGGMIGLKLPGDLVLPPAEKGAWATRISGCLAQAEPSEADAKSFPARGPTRGPAPAAVQVAPASGGIVVEHALEHACCLKGEVSTEVAGNTVTLTETLQGTPCRCRCASTLKTAVGLAPGDYTVEVVVAQGEDRQTVHQQPVSVR